MSAEAVEIAELAIQGFPLRPQGPRRFSLFVRYLTDYTGLRPYRARGLG